ncbi:MAG: sigma-70 family RNA polymerase sigma factor [Actinomycetota bacterium]|nr:sigma-70 family RNA polymerase sigma factor [Actinomycetota bacterium]
MLRRRRVPEWLADDIVQETGIKLWKMWDDVDPDRPVAGLGKAVAVNVLRDYWRQSARREVTGAVPDRAGIADVEREGLARTELRAVGRALRQLQPDYRGVLLAEVGLMDEPVRSGRGAIRMLRVRARRELEGLVDRGSSWGVVFGERVSGMARDFAGRMSARLGPREAEGLAYAAVGIVAVVVAGGLLPGDLFDRSGLDGRADTDPVMVAPNARMDVIASSAASKMHDPASIHGLRGLTREAFDHANDLLGTGRKRPLAKGRLGGMGGVAAKGQIETLGVRIGTADDGSLFVGCSDGTETGATGIGECDIGQGQTRAKAEVQYRFRDKKGRVRLGTDRRHRLSLP